MLRLLMMRNDDIGGCCVKTREIRDIIDGEDMRDKIRARGAMRVMLSLVMRRAVYYDVTLPAMPLTPITLMPRQLLRHARYAAR